MGLITDISQIRKVSTINITNTLPQWQPYLDEAEETFIKPLLGEDLLFSLNEYSQGSTIGHTPLGKEKEDLWAELLDKVRKPLALYSLWLGADEMAISISGQGIQIVQTETHKPAPQYQIQNLKESWMRRAHVAMDIVLSFLEKNKVSFQGYNSKFNDLFIRNAEEFQENYDIHSSRRVYLLMLPVLRNIEKKFIRPTLSPAYFDELKSAMQGSTGVSEDDQKVIDLIKPALTHLVVARALRDVSIDFLDWGVFLTASSTFDNVTNKSTANKDKVALLMSASEMDGQAELKELQEYLDTNASATKYVTYFNSARYIGEGKDPVIRNEFENKSENSIFLA